MEERLVQAYGFKIGYTYFKCIIDKFEKSDRYDDSINELKKCVDKIGMALYKPIDWYITRTEMIIIKQFMERAGETLKKLYDGSDMYMAFAFDNLYAIHKEQTEFVGFIVPPPELGVPELTLEYMNKLNDYFEKIIQDEQ